MFSLSIHYLMNFEIQPVEQNVFSYAISVYKNQINANIYRSAKCIICEIFQIDCEMIILGNTLQI